MKEIITKLLSVKSIVTLSMTAALIVLLLSGREPNKELLALYCSCYGAVITYFFTKKDDKGADK